jgi:hypothetical protein
MRWSNEPKHFARPSLREHGGIGTRIDTNRHESFTNANESALIGSIRVHS